MDNCLCEKILLQLHSVGFNNDQILHLFEEGNKDLLRDLYLEIVSRKKQLPEFIPHLHESVLTFLFSPLQLSLREWMLFFEKKNKKSYVCKILGENSFFAGDAFVEPIVEKKATAMLVASDLDNKYSIASIVDFAEEQMRGCSSTTKPSFIFEMLHQLWDQFNDMNASFVVVPTQLAKFGGKVPVILNSNREKILTLAVPQKIPLQSQFGYFAFCGSS